METIVRAPKIWLCEVSESIAAEKEYWLLALLVRTGCLDTYGDIRFSTSIYIFKPILSENTHY